MFDTRISFADRPEIVLQHFVERPNILYSDFEKSNRND